MTNMPLIRKPNEGPTIAVVGDVYRFMATSDDTNGKYAMWEAIVPPGGGPPPHVHSREEEAFYILEGEITFTVNGEKLVATAGCRRPDSIRSRIVLHRSRHGRARFHIEVTNGDNLFAVRDVCLFTNGGFSQDFLRNSIGQHLDMIC